MKPVRRIQCSALLSLLLLFTSFAQEAKVSSGSKIMISAHPLAAKAGMEIYKKGGNVVDVAVAVAYALGVVEPHGSGVGGEGMMLIYNAKEKKTTVIDFKGISPQGASYFTLDLKKASEWARSAKGAAVPGAVAGLELAREQFGRLDRTTVLQPAVNYALKGYAIDSTLALNLESYRRILEKDPYANAIYYHNGQTPTPGTIVKNPDYGRTLAAIQSGGAKAFYDGPIADLIVKDAQKRGAFIAMDDLRSYKAFVREPVIGEYPWIHHRHHAAAVRWDASR